MKPLTEIPWIFYLVYANRNWHWRKETPAFESTGLNDAIDASSGDWPTRNEAMQNAREWIRINAYQNITWMPDIDLLGCGFPTEQEAMELPDPGSNSG